MKIIAQFNVDIEINLLLENLETLQIEYALFQLKGVAKSADIITQIKTYKMFLLDYILINLYCIQYQCRGNILRNSFYDHNGNCGHR